MSSDVPSDLPTPPVPDPPVPDAAGASDVGASQQLPNDQTLAGQNKRTKYSADQNSGGMSFKELYWNVGTLYYATKLMEAIQLYRKYRMGLAMGNRFEPISWMNPADTAHFDGSFFDSLSQQSLLDGRGIPELVESGELGLLGGDATKIKYYAIPSRSGSPARSELGYTMTLDETTRELRIALKSTRGSLDVLRKLRQSYRLPNGDMAYTWNGVMKDWQSIRESFLADLKSYLQGDIATELGDLTPRVSKITMHGNGMGGSMADLVMSDMEVIESLNDYKRLIGNQAVGEEVAKFERSFQTRLIKTGSPAVVSGNAAKYVEEITQNQITSLNHLEDNLASISRSHMRSMDRFLGLRSSGQQRILNLSNRIRTAGGRFGSSHPNAYVDSVMETIPIEERLAKWDELRANQVGWEDLGESLQPAGEIRVGPPRAMEMETAVMDDIMQLWNGGEGTFTETSFYANVRRLNIIQQHLNIPAARRAELLERYQNIAQTEGATAETPFARMQREFGEVMREELDEPLLAEALRMAQTEQYLQEQGIALGNMQQEWHTMGPQERARWAKVQKAKLQAYEQFVEQANNQVQELTWLGNAEGDIVDALRDKWNEMDRFSIWKDGMRPTNLELEEEILYYRLRFQRMTQNLPPGARLSTERMNQTLEAYQQQFETNLGRRVERLTPEGERIEAARIRAQLEAQAAQAEREAQEVIRVEENTALFEEMTEAFQNVNRDLALENAQMGNWLFQFEDSLEQLTATARVTVGRTVRFLGLMEPGGFWSGLTEEGVGRTLMEMVQWARESSLAPYVFGGAMYFTGPMISEIGDLAGTFLMVANPGAGVGVRIGSRLLGNYVYYAGGRRILQTAATDVISLYSGVERNLVSNMVVQGTRSYERAALLGTLHGIDSTTNGMVVPLLETLNEELLPYAVEGLQRNIQAPLLRALLGDGQAATRIRQALEGLQTRLFNSTTGRLIGRIAQRIGRACRLAWDAAGVGLIGVANAMEAALDGINHYWQVLEGHVRNLKNWVSENVIARFPQNADDLHATYFQNELRQMDQDLQGQIRLLEEDAQLNQMGFELRRHFRDDAYIRGRRNFMTREDITEIPMAPGAESQELGDLLYMGREMPDGIVHELQGINQVAAINTQMAEEMARLQELKDANLVVGIDEMTVGQVRNVIGDEPIRWEFGEGVFDLNPVLAEMWQGDIAKTMAALDTGLFWRLLSKVSPEFVRSVYPGVRQMMALHPTAYSIGMSVGMTGIGLGIQATMDAIMYNGHLAKDPFFNKSKWDFWKQDSWQELGLQQPLVTAVIYAAFAVAPFFPVAGPIGVGLMAGQMFGSLMYSEKAMWNHQGLAWQYQMGEIGRGLVGHGGQGSDNRGQLHDFLRHIGFSNGDILNFEHVALGAFGGVDAYSPNHGVSQAWLGSQDQVALSVESIFGNEYSEDKDGKGPLYWVFTKFLFMDQLYENDASKTKYSGMQDWFNQFGNRYDFLYDEKEGSTNVVIRDDHGTYVPTTYYEYEQAATAWQNMGSIKDPYNEFFQSMTARWAAFLEEAGTTYGEDVIEFKADGGVDLTKLQAKLQSLEGAQADGASAIASTMTWSNQTEMNAFVTEFSQYFTYTTEWKTADGTLIEDLGEYMQARPTDSVSFSVSLEFTEAFETAYMEAVVNGDFGNRELDENTGVVVQGSGDTKQVMIVSRDTQFGKWEPYYFLQFMNAYRALIAEHGEEDAAQIGDPTDETLLEFASAWGTFVSSMSTLFPDVAASDWSDWEVLKEQMTEFFQGTDFEALDTEGDTDSFQTFIGYLTESSQVNASDYIEALDLLNHYFSFSTEEAASTEASSTAAATSEDAAATESTGPSLVWNWNAGTNVADALSLEAYLADLRESDTITFGEYSFNFGEYLSQWESAQTTDVVWTDEVVDTIIGTFQQELSDAYSEYIQSELQSELDSLKAAQVQKYQTEVDKAEVVAGNASIAAHYAYVKKHGSGQDATGKPTSHEYTVKDFQRVVYWNRIRQFLLQKRLL